MRSFRYSEDTVATVNGWQIVRYQFGAGIGWRAIKLDAGGYLDAKSDEFPTKRAAIAYANAH